MYKWVCALEAGPVGDIELEPPPRLGLQYRDPGIPVIFFRYSNTGIGTKYGVFGTNLKIIVYVLLT
jgi:hypothetical protein